MITADDTRAVVSDLDTDTLFIVDLAGIELAYEPIALEPGDEPGRAAQDGAGRVHVVLRRGGAVVSLDLATGLLTARRDVCRTPRGIAWRESDDTLVVACLEGELMFLPASPESAEPTRRVFVDTDLRDIVLVAAGRMLVSRFRSAEVLTLDAAGAIVERRRPPVVTRSGFVRPVPVTTDAGVEPRAPVTGEFDPTMAWRMVSDGEGGALLIHQRAFSGEVPLDATGYGVESDPCGAIVRTAVSMVPATGAIAASPDFVGALAVDGAIDIASAELALAMVGETARYLADRDGGDEGTYLHLPDAPVFSISAPLAETPCVAANGEAGYEGRAEGGSTVALARSTSHGWITLARAPTRVRIDGTVRRRVVVLSDRATAHYGHRLFHTATPRGIACASCHGEGGEDGHVWQFRGIGPRRSQALRGGIAGTEPFHWDGDMESFAQLTHDVMAARMGGPALGGVRLDDFATWIDSMDALPAPAVDEDAAARGRALFESAEVGCASCHAGRAFTTSATIDVGTGGAFQVPMLLGVAHRAPYMHDGCAPTLRERFTNPACGGGDMHGRTSTLTPEQVDDLVQYLTTL